MKEQVFMCVELISAKPLKANLCLKLQELAEYILNRTAAYMQAV